MGLQKRDKVGDCEHCKEEHKTTPKFYWKFDVQCIMRDKSIIKDINTILEQGYFCSE